jgi:hypothetical protein
MKIEKQSIELLEKLTVKFISFLSNKSSEICIESGKKTLAVSHVVEALKKLKLDSHIKRLFSELDINFTEEENELDKNDLQEMKQTLNNKKKKSMDKKSKKIEITEEMAQEQMMLFHQSKMEAYDLLLKESQCNGEIPESIKIVEEEEENYD